MFFTNSLRDRDFLVKGCKPQVKNIEVFDNLVTAFWASWIHMFCVSTDKLLYLSELKHYILFAYSEDISIYNSE